MSEFRVPHSRFWPHFPPAPPPSSHKGGQTPFFAQLVENPEEGRPRDDPALEAVFLWKIDEHEAHQHGEKSLPRQDEHGESGKEQETSTAVFEEQQGQAGPGFMPPMLQGEVVGRMKIVRGEAANHPRDQEQGTQEEQQGQTRNTTHPARVGTREIQHLGPDRLHDADLPEFERWLGVGRAIKKPRSRGVSNRQVGQGPQSLMPLLFR